ncbi:MAG TPA: PadR family transcriptional regulator [Longimicrobiales bacterium]|nr:PadR family transcriptional regulator [Longimicrobiales bacterium]
MTFDNSRCHVVGRQGINRGTDMAPKKGKEDLLQGTLDLLILKTLRLGPLHGWGVAKRIERLSEEALAVGQGSLYPALYRLEDRGLIEAEWGTSPEGRRAKFYRLTASGRRAFAAEQQSWRRFADGIERVLAAES